MLKFKGLFQLSRIATQYISTKTQTQFYSSGFVKPRTVLPIIQVDIKRFKKSQAKSADKKIILSSKIKTAIDVESLQADLATVFNNLEELYENHFQLYLNPELILDTQILVPDGNTKTLKPLRQYANIILQNNDDVIMKLELDMSGHTNLLKVAEKSLQNIGISSQPSGNGLSLLVSIPPPTPERRENVAKQCKERMFQTMKEMDKIYGKHLKKCNDKDTVAGISESDVYDAKEFLKMEVKKAHKEVENLFEWKKDKLLND